VKDLTVSCLPLSRPFTDIHERLRSLHLHWITYETLFQQVPDSELKQPSHDFARRFNATKSVQPREVDGSQTLHLTGTAILVFRGSSSLQAAPAVSLVVGRLKRTKKKVDI